MFEIRIPPLQQQLGVLYLLILCKFKNWFHEEIGRSKRKLSLMLDLLIS